MKEIKKNDFMDLNILKQFDIVIYTPVLCAGVDFNYSHFDSIIAVQCKNENNESYNIDGFVQSVL